MLHLAIVEDDPTAEKILIEYLEGQEITVNALYTTGEEALDQIPKRPLPDIVLADLGLPGISGVELIGQLKARYPHLEIVVQTVFDDVGTIVKAIAAGASGYILKATSREEIINALIEVKRGGSFLTPKVARSLLSEFQKPKEAERGKKTDLTEIDLTKREEEILQYLIAGVS